MKLETSQVTKLTLSEIEGLDPVHVYLEDVGPRHGRLTIVCWDEAWTTYWGGMGDQSLAEFLVSVNVGYIANRLSSIDRSVPAEEDPAEAAKLVLVKARQKKDVTAEEARSLFDNIEFGLLSDQQVEGKMEGLIGEDWRSRIPQKANPQYTYLCRIITATQEGCRELLKAKSASVAA